MSIDGYPREIHDCLETSQTPMLCLRLEAPRERVALPYASLTSTCLSTDETMLTLAYVTHLVTVKGRKLAAIHRAVAAGSAAAIVVGKPTFRSKLKPVLPSRIAPPMEPMEVNDIRIQPVSEQP